MLFRDCRPAVDQPNDKRMRLRFAGTCRICGTELPAQTEAVYERSLKRVRCLTHDAAAGPTPVDDVLVDPGTPGASARRELERRRARAEERTRARHPRLGGLIVALSEDPQSTRAWATGAVGEERLGARLDGLASDRLRVLHDRRIPGTRANIDHLVVSPTGIHVIDAKRYRGRPRLRVEGGMVRPRTERLVVGSRTCTPLVDGVLRQVDVVRGAMPDDVPVQGYLCFVDADWPLVGGDFTTRGVHVLWPRKLCSGLDADGGLAPETVDGLHRCLASALPQA